MVKSLVPFATSVALLAAAINAASVPDGTWPASTGTVQYSEAYVIKAGEVFDGKMQTFERSDITCEGQTESGANTAVFKMEPGATLKNAIIGKNQMEGVHCDKHDCVIDNVWWDDVCEDALSIKGGTASSVSKVIGGGARYADDKVIQHNGYGTVEIDGFYGEDISKLYRSCGTCGDRPKKVSVSNVYVVNPGNAIVTVNQNWGDEATLSNVWVKSSSDKVKICQWSQGNANGEPKMLGNGPSPPLCQYAESDVHINEDISQAAQTSPSVSSTSSSSSATQTASSSSTASSDLAQTASSTSTEPSLTSSASYQTYSSTDASEEAAPGTVTPVENDSVEQSIVSSDASQMEQQETAEDRMSASSVSSSISGSLYSSSDDMSQIAEQQSSLAFSSDTDMLDCGSSAGSNTQQGEVPSQPSSEASSNANDVPQTDLASSNADDVSQTDTELDCGSSAGSNTQQGEVPSWPSSVTSSNADDVSQTDTELDCGSSAGSNTQQGEVPSQPSSVASSNPDDVSQPDTELDCGSSAGSSTQQGEVPSQPSSVASSNANDVPQIDTELDCGSSSGSTEQVEVPAQQPTPASGSAGSSIIVQDREQMSASGSATASTGSIEQNSSTSSFAQSLGSDMTTQTDTNSTGSIPDGTWPASTGTVLYTKPYTVKAGEVFDGKMQTFERSDIKCTEGEGQKDSAVFLVEAGGTLKNAIIGKNQKEGVHCDDHDCVIENVWWDDVCEDALSVKGGSATSVTTVTNCGARYASDKVVQHNGYGTVKINGFFAQEFGKLYRSCGTCGDIPRTVTVENVYAIDPLVSVITVNKNYGDQATLRNIHVKTTDGKDDVKVCQWSQGSKTPSSLGDGPSGTLCQYTDSDVHINEE